MMRQFFFKDEPKVLIDFLEKERGPIEVEDLGHHLRICGGHIQIKKYDPLFENIPNVVLDYDASKEAGDVFSLLERHFKRSRKEVEKHYYGRGV